MIAKPKSHRGRPVGTGIDDSDRLKSIVDLLSANPELRPTTAIKSLGLSDPSIIRRLRDKLKTMPASHHGHAGGPDETPPSSHVKRHRVAAASNVRPFKISELPSKPAANPAAPSAASTPMDALSLAFMDMTVRAVSATLTAQQALFSLMLQNPFVRLALHQHVALNQAVLQTLPTIQRRTA